MRTGGRQTTGGEKKLKERFLSVTKRGGKEMESMTNEQRLIELS